MELLPAALLGVVQGLTEFLPVSSSGHLILARAVLGWDAGQFGLAFDVACHLGTLMAVLACFRQDVLAMVRSTPAALAGGVSEPARLVRLVAVGTLPVVVVGLALGDALEGEWRSAGTVVVALVCGAVALLAAERFGGQVRDAGSLTYGDALVIGTAQAVALVPGVSRSGATLTAALLLGVRREAAARFVFLLSLPAVLAAAGKAGKDLFDTGADVPIALFATGFVVSAIVGYVTVKMFIRWLAGHSLDVFAYYRLAMAGATGLWLFAR